MVLDSLSTEIIRGYFSNAFYARGHHYYRQGRVSGLTFSSLLDGTFTLTSTVRGSRVYKTEIEVSAKSKFVRIVGKCTCPIGSNCKHVVATLLAAVNQSVVDKHTIPLSQPTYDASVTRWLEKLTDCLHPKANDRDSIDETYQLFYVFSSLTSYSADLGIKLFLARTLQAGNLGAPKAFSPTAAAQQKHLHPMDKVLLAKLEAIRKLANGAIYSNGYSLTGKLGEEMLPELLLTGRCHWQTLKNPPLKLASSQPAQFQWEMNEEGFQTLRCYVGDKPLPVFFIEKSWYIDGSEMGLVEMGIDAKVSRLLLSAPKISPEAIESVSDYLLKHQKVLPLISPKRLSQVEITSITPIPCLRLFNAIIRAQGTYKNHWQPVETQTAVATLHFDYQGKRIAWNDERQMIQIVQSDQVIQMQRNNPAESAAFDKLIGHNFTLMSVIPELERLNQKLASYFLFDEADSDPLHFSVDIVPQLRQQGWRIEIAEDYLYRVIEEPIDEWYSSIDEETSRDWFGFELGISVKGKQINLLPILQNLLPRLKADDRTLSDGSKPVFAKLPDGSHVSLPRARIQSILNILIELYDQESLTEDQQLRLSKLHAQRLIELEKACGAAKLHWFGGEKLRKLAKQLVQFKGIKLAEVPNIFKGKLRPYQLEGLSWLQFLREYEFGGILADDMGLGKTVQALSHIALEKSSGRMNHPVLVVAPTSLMFNWEKEAERFCPSLRVLILQGAQRKQYFHCISETDLIVTTYPLLIRDKEQWLKQHFYLLILDEAQSIKNAASLSAQIALQIKADHKLCLTGTPMENHLGELWSLLHFMMPGLLGEASKFKCHFRTPIEKHGDEARRHHLNQRIAPFILRRTKDKVVKELPPKVEILRHVELEGAQRDLYETIRVSMQKKVSREIAKLGLARSHIIILDALLKLRQVCCDPRLLKTTTAKTQRVKSAKLEYVMSLILELLEEGRRILLFSQFTSMLALIESELKAQKIDYVKLTGKTQDRQAPIQAFQTQKVPLFLISLKAGGTGLNLTAADTVIHYDPWWNPAVEHQATDRAHRIGQNKTVFVYKIVAKGTVEEKMLEMQQEKHALMEGLFSDKTASKLKLTEQDLQGLFDPVE